MKRALVAGLGMVAFSAMQASAADLPLKARPMAPIVTAFNWTGCHIGGNVGGKWVRTEGSVDVGPTLATTGAGGTAPAALGGSILVPSGDTSTLIAGGQLGCDWQAPGSNWVFGIEGDVDWQRWSRTTTVGASVFPFVAGDSFDWRSRWQGSARGRIGYAWDRVLLYVTGGAAFTDLTVNTNYIASGIFPASINSQSQTIWGPTVGGGFEYAFTNNFTAGIEGRYTWYGTHTYNTGLLATTAATTAGVTTFATAPTQQTVKLNTFEVMGKLNWKIF